LSIEDPVAEDDTAGMIAFTAAAGHKVQIIGDDYLVTNAARVRDAAAAKACNSVLIKPNQAGTISETFDALQAAKACGFSTVVSARSGESEDVMISHLSVGWNAGQLKPVANVWRNGTSCCELRKRSVPRLSMPAAVHCQCRSELL
jgi:enolase